MERLFFTVAGWSTQKKSNLEKNPPLKTNAGRELSFAVGTIFFTVEMICFPVRVFFPAQRLFFLVGWGRVPGNARGCLGMPGDAQECLGMTGDVRECLRMPRHAFGMPRGCHRMLGDAWNCFGMSRRGRLESLSCSTSKACSTSRATLIFLNHRKVLLIFPVFHIFEPVLYLWACSTSLGC